MLYRHTTNDGTTWRSQKTTATTTLRKPAIPYTKHPIAEMDNLCNFRPVLQKLRTNINLASDTFGFGLGE